MDSNFRQLCIAFLEGKSSLVDEARLASMLQDTEKLREFKEIESVWAESHRPDTADFKAIKKIKKGISFGTRGRSVFYWVAATAVVAAALFLLLGKVRVQEDAAAPVYAVVSTESRDQKTVILPDGSKVFLNSSTRITYPEDFSAGRKVSLSGEAFFEVVSDPLHPFVVNVRGNDISVLGTKFNVCAYENAASVTTALVEGKVVFSNSELSLAMKPGEVISYECATGSLTKKKADVGAYLSWMGGRLDYDSISLRDLLSRLAEVYSLDIRYSPAKYADSRFRISLNIKEPIDNVLNAVSAITPIGWTAEGNVISIKEL